MSGMRAESRFAFLGLLSVVAVGPAPAEVDLSGVWANRLFEDQPEIGPGAEFGNFTGLPINDEARKRGLSWHPSLHNVPEHQCQQLGALYAARHSDQWLWKEVNPNTQQVIAWHLLKSYHNAKRTIWMDGRPRPPEYAPHTFSGFSTGEWVDDKLVVTTTHLKQGILRRNGIWHSDRATLIEHFIRHEDHLTVTLLLDDPVYLTEPVMFSSNYVLDLQGEIDPYPCEVVTELPRLSHGLVPHFLPWANPHAENDAAGRDTPMEIWLGGAHTMYPTLIEGTAR